MIVSCTGASRRTRPASMRMPRSQSVLAAIMLCVTNRTLRPPRLTSCILPRHFLLKRDVADRQHFVHEQNFAVEVRGHREREAQVHAARVVLHRRVDEGRDLGELDDLVELAPDFRTAHAQDGAVQEDVLAAGELGVKAGADLEQAGDAAAAARSGPRWAR